MPFEGGASTVEVNQQCIHIIRWQCWVLKKKRGERGVTYEQSCIKTKQDKQNNINNKKVKIKMKNNITNILHYEPSPDTSDTVL